MDEEILVSIKNLLGPNEWTDFDDQIIEFINDALLSLDQIGCIDNTIGIIDSDTLWSDILNNPPGLSTVPMSVLSAIKMYIYIRVKLLFDPPASNNNQYYEGRANELFWRLLVAYEKFN